MTDQKKRDELNALADRCEREEPSIALDASIQSAVRGVEVACLGGNWIFRDTSVQPPTWRPLFARRYTISLDETAAPDCEGVFWRSGHDGEGPDPSLFKAEVLVVTDTGSRSSFGIARTEAMARRAAELRARASLLGESP